ncbi:MAG TPA: SDR family oxidoreductase [Mycobacteriales bacterium]|nr:SDR family oxidoreductase [Mycobacteriales bacterium]
MDVLVNNAGGNTDLDRSPALTGRAGTVDDVVAAVAYLASPGAGHVTGQVLHVNGGAHLGG